MNAMTQRLLATLKARGLAITGPKPGQPDDTLNLTGPEKERTPEVFNALKLCKPQLVAMYGRNQEPLEEQPAGE